MKRRLNRDTPYRMKAPHKFSFEKNRRFDIPDARVAQEGARRFRVYRDVLVLFHGIIARCVIYIRTIGNSRENIAHPRGNY